LDGDKRIHTWNFFLIVGGRVYSYKIFYETEENKSLSTPILKKVSRGGDDGLMSIGENESLPTLFEFL